MLVDVAGTDPAAPAPKFGTEPPPPPPPPESADLICEIALAPAATELAIPIPALIVCLIPAAAPAIGPNSINALAFAAVV